MRILGFATALSLLAPAALAATTWSAFDDFGRGGPWTYGWCGALGQPFVPFGAAVELPEGTAWRVDAGRADPVVLRNGSGAEIVRGEIVYAASRYVYLHPGPDGAYSIVRFVAPEAGEYAIEAEFVSLRVAGRGATTHVLVNVSSAGVAVEGRLEGHRGDAAASLAHAFRVWLEPGQWVDFCAGPGEGGHACDSTGLAVAIRRPDLLLRKEFEGRVVAWAQLERNDRGPTLRLAANMPVFKAKLLERLNEEVESKVGEEIDRLPWGNFRFSNFRAAVDAVSFGPGADPGEAVVTVSGHLIAAQERFRWEELAWRPQGDRDVASFVAPFRVRVGWEGEGPLAAQTVVLSAEPLPTRATIHLKPIRGLVVEGLFAPPAPEPQRFPIGEANPPPLPLRLGSIRFAVVSDEQLILAADLASR